MSVAAALVISSAKMNATEELVKGLLLVKTSNTEADQLKRTTSFHHILYHSHIEIKAFSSLLLPIESFKINE